MRVLGIVCLYWLFSALVQLQVYLTLPSSRFSPLTILLGILFILGPSTLSL